MDSLIYTYEKQFGQLTSDVTVKLGSINESRGAEKKSLISATERQLDEAQELLEQMDLEVRELPNSERGKLMNRVKSYQNEFNNLETKLKKLKLTSLTNPSKLREDFLAYEDSGVDDQKTRLLDNSERLENSSRRLDVGYRVATETEKIGQDILDNLHRDRETLTRSRQRLREGNANIGKSSRVLTSMMNRIMQNRLIMLLTMMSVVVMIVVFIYLSIKKHNR